MKILILLFAFLGSLPLRGAIISSFERLDSPLPPGNQFTLHRNFDGRAPVWSDYTFVFAGVPNYLIGADIVRTPYTSEVGNADFRLRITLEQSATVFLLIDNRVPDVATALPWVSALGFADTGDDVIFRQITTASIYTGSFPAGQLTLFEQNGAPGQSGMYVVGAVPEPGCLASFLAGTALCFRRRPSQAKRATLPDAPSPASR